MAGESPRHSLILVPSSSATRFLEPKAAIRYDLASMALSSRAIRHRASRSSPSRFAASRSSALGLPETGPSAPVGPRATWFDARRVCAILASAVVLVAPIANAAAADAHTKPAAPAGAAADPRARVPGEESPGERRAVRGVPIDEIGPSESPELREIRRFEELAFPRAGGVRPGAADGALPPVSLPGSWGGSGDVPAELRSPPSSERPEPTAAPDSEWLRGLKLPDLPVRWDAQVLRYLDYFKNDPKGHAVMANWLRRAGRYRDLFDRVLAREGLPRDLLYVAMVESGFDNGARSRVGAGGIWQFMPSAARTYGLEVSYWTDARRDPERAVEAAARYLKDLYVRFGSWYLVFAAYNAGYGAVLRSITSYNTNDYWELVRHESGLPWESSLYVPKILAAAIVGNNPGAFGLGDVTPDPPFAYEEVEVPAGTALTTVARAAGAKPEVLEALNPQLVRGRTAPDRGAGRVRVPQGTATACAESFDKARGSSDKLDTVVLRFGETLDDVARARGLSARELRRLNGVKDSGELRAGTAVVVPKRAVASKDERPGKDERASGGDRAVAPEAASGADDDAIIVAVPERAFSYEGRERVFYRTRDGDELDEIADAFGVRSEDLVEWNNLDPAAKLHPKMVVQIFVRKDFDPAGVVLLDASKVRVVTLGSEEFLELETARRGKKRLLYTAKAGDTLVKLGRRYGLTPGDLARINRFSYNTELHEGDKVVVYSPTGDAPREVTMGMASGKKRPDRGATPPVRAPVPRPETAGASRKATANARTVAVGPSTTTDAKKKPAGGTKTPERTVATSGPKGADKGTKSAKPGDKLADKGAAKSSDKGAAKPGKPGDKKK
jgi:membrane-bound lytic murein transglycosylase D